MHYCVPLLQLWGLGQLLLFIVLLGILCYQFHLHILSVILILIHYLRLYFLFFPINLNSLYVLRQLNYLLLKISYFKHLKICLKMHSRHQWNLLFLNFLLGLNLQEYQIMRIYKIIISIILSYLKVANFHLKFLLILLFFSLLVCTLYIYLKIILKFLQDICHSIPFFWLFIYYSYY